MNKEVKSSSSDKPKESKESNNKEEPEKERRGSTSTVHASFPSYPSHTTDLVRLKCREMLCNAITGDGNLVDGKLYYKDYCPFFRDSCWILMTLEGFRVFKDQFVYLSIRDVSLLFLYAAF